MSIQQGVQLIESIKARLQDDNSIVQYDLSSENVKDLGSLETVHLEPFIGRIAAEEISSAFLKNEVEAVAALGEILGVDFKMLQRPTDLSTE